MNTYALLISSIVVNVILADEEFIESLDPLVADEAVLIEEGTAPPPIGYLYSGGEFVPALSKPQAIAQQIAAFRTDFRAWIDTRYDQPTRINFISMFLLAKETGKTNRLAYIQPLLEWSDSLVTFAGTVATAIQSQSTAADVLAYQWSFISLEQSDPRVTLLAAVQIPD